MEVFNVIILPTSNGLYDIVEAWETKYGYSHSEGVIMDGFVSREDAEDYCELEGYKVLNK